MNAYLSEEKIQQIEWAYAEMQRRGWGFKSFGNPSAEGFGDPATPMTAVGPMTGPLVEVLAVDPDPVEAVKKAIEVANGK